MGPLGWQETVFIFILALLVFGPKKLPELGKTIGKAMIEFRRASSELKSTWDREMASVERETESIKEVTHSYQKEIASSYHDPEDSGYEYGYNHEEPQDGSVQNDSSTVGASAIPGADDTVHTAEIAAHQPDAPDPTPASESLPHPATPPAEGSELGSHAGSGSVHA